MHLHHLHLSHYLSLTFDLYTCACDSLSLVHPCCLAQSPPPRLCVPSPLHRLATRFWRWMAAAFWASHTTKPSGSWSRHGTWWWRWKTWAVCRTPGQWWVRPSGSLARRSQRAPPTAAWQGEFSYPYRVLLLWLGNTSTTFYVKSKYINSSQLLWYQQQSMIKLWEMTTSNEKCCFIQMSFLSVSDYHQQADSLLINPQTKTLKCKNSYTQQINAQNE